VLADVQGYDYREVSQAASVPVGTVKSRLARARARLRDCLQRYRELLPESYRLKDE
jgi:RNA polymerase sigma-70 factor (ECF subfamily)